jgi:hypothetical protein
MAVTIAGNILASSQGEALPISMGGTGQTTAPTALNALLPVQTGQAGKILVTNGTNVSWSGATMSPGGADTNIQFNDSGSFGGNSSFVINKSTGALTSTSTFKGIGLTISDSDALTRTLRYQTLGSDRWLMMANNTAETGASSGSDFALVRVADNGATSNIVFEISRATGVFDFKVAPTLNGSSLSTGLTHNYVGFGSASNVLTGSTGFQYIETGTYPALTGTLYVGDGDNGVAGAIITPRPGTLSGIGLTIQAGAGGTSAAGTLYLRGGNRAGGIGTSDSGHVVIATGTGPQTGAIYMQTGGATRFIIDQNGTWFLGASNGSSGQVLTSSGSGNPTWTTPSGGAASTLTGTTLASNVVSSSLTSVGTLANLTVTNPISGSVTGNAATATTATNLAGGGIGYVPYQSASGTTAFLNAGTSGYVLTSNGAGIAPTWSVAGSASYPTNQVVYGTGSGSTSTSAFTYDPSTNLLTVGGSGMALVEAGTSQSLKMLSDTSVIVSTGTVGSNTDRLVINPSGGFAFNGSYGTSGQVLVSAGSGASAGWSGTPTIAGTNFTAIPNSALTNSSVTVGSTSIALGATSTTLAGLTSVSATTFTGALTGHASSDVALAGATMTGLLILSGDPTNDLGAVTKQYADAIAAGVNVHAACETATAAPLAACTYANGTAGVGATLTGNANGNLGSIGGYTPVGGWVSTSRILVKDQAAGIQNGIYTVTQAGSGSLPFILTRATDFDGSPTSEVGPGDLTYVQEGSLAGTQWVETAVGTGVPGDYIIIGTDAMTFGQFSGASSYTAGTGINIASNVISNTGVTSIVAGTNISISGSTGAVTVNSTASGFTTTDDNSTNATYYPALVTTAGGSTAKTSSTQLTFNPSTAALKVAGIQVGYLTVPQNTQNANYTTVLADSGKHIYSAAGASSVTWTIPTNASVPYDIGTAITFVNQSSVAISIACGDTLYLAGAGTAGTRTVGTYGVATALKTSATTWIISGTAVT